MKEQHKRARQKEEQSAQAEDPRREIGRRGEQIAADYMRERGWRELARNYQLNIGEIDLVMQRTERLVGRSEETCAIIEVKTRTHRNGPPPQAGVNYPKRQRLTQLALLFLAREQIERVNIRFDVIAVDLSGEEPVVAHFPCAFDAEGEVW